MGQAKQYFLHSHKISSKMKAHQEEKTILNPPPSKHYEWRLLYSLIRGKSASMPSSGCQLLSLHRQYPLGRRRQLLTEQSLLRFTQ